MTSMPASRSARAMIFAPRSCPSKPGLATTTRIFLFVAVGMSGRRGLFVRNGGRPTGLERHDPRRAATHAPFAAAALAHRAQQPPVGARGGLLAAFLEQEVHP